MPTERIIDLIHRDLDRETTPAESSELREILASDLPAREEYESVRDVVQQLDSIEQSDPPAGFKASVIDRIKAGQQERPHVRLAPPIASSPPSLRRRNFARVAYGVAAGTLLGVVLSALFLADPTTLRPIDASGTMSGAATEGWKLVATRTVSRAGVEATIEVKRSGDRVALLTRLHAPDARQVEIRWSPANAQLEAVAREGGASSLRAYDGSVLVDARGRATITAIVNEREAAVSRIVITGDRAPVLELNVGLEKSGT